MGAKHSKRLQRPTSPVSPKQNSNPSSTCPKKTTTTNPSLYDPIQEDWPWVWGIRHASNLDWKIGRNDEDIQYHIKKQQQLPAKITDSVYLGSALTVQNATRLESLGITAVLNMAGSRALQKDTIKEYEKRGIKYRTINAQDEKSYPVLEKHWQEALEFITSSLSDGKGKCIVNCMAGVNRSGLIVAAYYMMITQTPVLETVKHIRTQRGSVALNNEGFQQQLVAMARMNDLLGPMPGTEGCIVQEEPPPTPPWIGFLLEKKNENPVRSF